MRFRKGQLVEIGTRQAAKFGTRIADPKAPLLIDYVDAAAHVVHVVMPDGSKFLDGSVTLAIASKILKPAVVA